MGGQRVDAIRMNDPWECSKLAWMNREDDASRKGIPASLGHSHKVLWCSRPVRPMRMRGEGIVYCVRESKRMISLGHVFKSQSGRSPPNKLWTLSTYILTFLSGQTNTSTVPKRASVHYQTA